MLRTSRAILNNRMEGFNSTADLPGFPAPGDVDGLKIWLKGGYPGTGDVWGCPLPASRVATLANTTWSGNGLAFDGSTSSSKVNYDDGLAFSGADPVSMGCVFTWASSTDAYNALIASDDVHGYGMTLLLKSDQTTACYFSGTGSFDFDGLGSTIPFSTRTFLMATFDGSTIKTYINGVLDVTHSATGDYALSTAGFGVGYSSNFGRYFDGNMEDILLYSGALSAIDVANLAGYLGF